MAILPNPKNPDTAIQFANLVLPQSGGYFYSVNPVNGLWMDHFAPTIDDLIRGSRNADRSSNNVYFCTASFSASGSRKAEFAQAKKCFYLDLDVGKKRDAYAGHEAASEAAEDLIATLGVGRPVWINSGKGIHLYWPLGEAISVETWKPIAEKFKAWAIGTGAIIDKAVPADVVRVLRLPNLTWRDKNGVERDRTVALVEWGDGPFTLEEIDAAVSGRSELSKAANNDDWELGPIPDYILRDRVPKDERAYPTRDWTPDLEKELRSALRYLSADDYEGWWQVASMLRAHGEDGWRVFLWWSEACASEGAFDPDGCREKWSELATSHGGKDRTGYVAEIFSRARGKGWPGFEKIDKPLLTGFRYDAPTHSAGWMLDQGCPPIEWAFEKVLVRDCVGVITAPGGVGKTFIALQMGVSMATGIPWLGKFAPSSVGRVALISAETDTKTFQRRLHSVVAHHKQMGEWSEDAGRAIRENLWLIGIPPEEPVHLLFMDGKGRVRKEEEVVEKIIEQVGNLKPDLIFLDTRNLFCGGDENSAPVAGAFMRALSEIRTRTGARNLIVLDHANKSSSADESMALSQNASAGSVQFINNAKWQMAMAVAKRIGNKEVPPNQARDYVRCAVPKNNDGPQPEDFLLLRGEGGVLRFVTEGEVLGRMAPLAEEERKSLVKALNALIAKNGGEAIPSTQILRGKDHELQCLGGERIREKLLDDAVRDGFVSVASGRAKNSKLHSLTEKGLALAWEDS